MSEPAVLHLCGAHPEELARAVQRVHTTWRPEPAGEGQGLLHTRRFERDPRWTGAGENPSHVTLLEGLGAEAALALSQVDAPPDATAPADARGPLCSAYRERTPPSRGAPAPRGRAILQVFVDVEREFDSVFLPWYVEVHVPAVLEAPGMLAARRYENLRLDVRGRAPLGQHRFLTVYEMEDVRVIDRPETLAAAQRGACPRALEPHRIALNQTYVECLEASAAD